MQFNKQKLFECCHHLAIYSDNQLIELLNSKIDWLITHNKNYTKEQYYLLLELQEIIQALEA